MTFPRKVMRMTEPKRFFTVEYHGRSYILEVYEWTTLETVWASQMYWFMPGSKVTITDDNGNSQNFVKE